MMILSSDLTFSILYSNIFEYSFLVLVRISFGLGVRLSVMLTPVSFNFFLFLNILFLTLYLANMMLIGLDCLCFEVFLSNDFDLYQYLSFSCKRSFKVSVKTVSVSSFSLSFTSCNKIQFLGKYCSCLSMTLFKSSIFYPSSSFLPVH